MTENQTRPELNKQAHHLLHEAIGHDEKCKDCDYYQKRDFHAKPICVAAYTLVLCRQKNCDHEKWAQQKDVLREREAYEKEISSLEKVAGKPIVKLKEWYEESLRKANKRAEAAEMEAKANANGWKIEREELEKSERKRERAEARELNWKRG